MLKKVVGLTLTSILVVIFVMQVKFAGAEEKKKPITGPITNPITSPITPTPTCKPGNGFGDKNHCHFGPPGQVGKDHDDNNDHEGHNNGQHGHNDD